jgi:hypothetical protein
MKTEPTYPFANQESTLRNGTGVPRLSPFQTASQSLLREVLDRHGVRYEGFNVEDRDKQPWLRAEFHFQELPHRIELSKDMVVMWAGDAEERLFEPYLASEFKSERALAEGFARRLDRYLGGGDWAGPEELGLWDSLRSWLQGLLR